jgi:hypothetical protein
MLWLVVIVGLVSLYTVSSFRYRFSRHIIARKHTKSASSCNDVNDVKRCIKGLRNEATRQISFNALLNLSPESLALANPGDVKSIMVAAACLNYTTILTDFSALLDNLHTAGVLDCEAVHVGIHAMGWSYEKNDEDMTNIMDKISPHMQSKNKMERNSMKRLVIELISKANALNIPFYSIDKTAPDSDSETQCRIVPSTTTLATALVKEMTLALERNRPDLAVKIFNEAEKDRPLLPYRTLIDSLFPLATALERIGDSKLGSLFSVIISRHLVDLVDGDDKLGLKIGSYITPILSLFTQYSIDAGDYDHALILILKKLQIQADCIHCIHDCLAARDVEVKVEKLHLNVRQNSQQLIELYKVCIQSGRADLQLRLQNALANGFGFDSTFSPPTELTELLLMDIKK